MLTGTNSKHTKAFNHRIVMETIRLHSPLSRADIARRTALTPQTVSNIVSTLIDEDLVREAGKRRQGQGAPSITLAINPEGAYSIGLDLDRDHLTGLLVDLSGEVRQRIHHELSFPDPAEGIDLMVHTVRNLLDQEPLSLADVSGVGVGFPGPIEIVSEAEGRTSVNPKAFPGWDDVPLIARLQEHIDRPILLENNATAAAVGERWYGLGQSVSTFFYLLFGVGLGGGLVVDGHPYEGTSGNAGEVGYIPVLNGHSLPDGLQPTHLGEYYHLPRLYDQLRQAGYDVETPADLQTPFDQDATVLHEWLDTVTERLAPVLVSIECLFDPGALVFGGRLPDPVLDALLTHLEDRLPSLRTDGMRTQSSLRPATAGEDAGALGVATLPIYDLFAPTPHLIFNKQADQQTSLS
jgi:predicted NBD/HSP70 family sugar kinase